MYYVYPKGLPNQVLGWFPERKNAEAFQMLDCENREIAEWYKTTKSNNTYDVGRGAENLSYLEPLSEQAKAFIIAEKKAGNKNIYHSIMSVFDNRLKKNVMESLPRELDKYMLMKNFSPDKRPLVEEIMGLCYKKLVERGRIREVNS